MKAVDLRKGKTILYNGELAIVHEATHVTKGNKRSYIQTRVKMLKGGTLREVRFRVDDQIEIPFVESKEYEYLYKDGAYFVLMDPESFDQITVSEDIVGEATAFLKPNEKVSCQILDEQVVSFELPFTVELEVKDCPPNIKGATATNQSKEAILETGAKVRVPPFVDIGTMIRVDTRSGEYIERVR